MYRKNSANISELINRFEVNNDSVMTDKYTRLMRTQGIPEEIDINRSLMKFNNSGPQYQFQDSKMTNARKLTQQKVASILHKISGFLEMLSRFPLPRMSTMSVGLISLFSIFVSPRNLGEKFLYPGFRLVFCIIYPAYASYKAIRNKNVKEYVRWMMYWVVFAFLTCMEMMSDMFLAWLPFYNELKVVFLIWLLGGRGSSSLYKSIIHPSLLKRERDIDEFIFLAQEEGYTAALRLSSKGVHSIKNVLMPGEDISEISSSYNLSRNYSMSDISDADTIQSHEDIDDLIRLRNLSANKVTNYGGQYRNFSYEDISSGYSSPDASIRSGPPVFPDIRNRSRIPKDNFEEDLNMGRDSDVYYRNAPKLSQNMPKHFQRIEDIREISTPINESDKNELSEDEIIAAYEKLKKQKVETQADPTNNSMTKEMKEKYDQFLKWMEGKKEHEKELEMNSSSPILKDQPKVNVQEDEKSSDVVNVAKVEHENSAPDLKLIENMIEKVEDSVVSDFDEFKDTISISSEDNFSDPEILEKEGPTELGAQENEELSIAASEVEKCEENEKAQENLGVEEKLNIKQEIEEPIKDSAEKLEAESIPIKLEPDSLNSSNEQSISTVLEPEKPKSLFKPYTVKARKLNDEPSSSDSKLEKEEEIIKSIKGSLENIEKIMVEAKLTLSDQPLEVTSSISNIGGSNTSLSSNRSREKSVESNKKKSASHSKGRAPRPPSRTPPPDPKEQKPATELYYDKLTKKFFKETEL